MFKVLFAILIVIGSAGAGYWYGYKLGQEDARSSNQSRSLESKAELYMNKLESIDVQYKDKDGNIVIPKVKWDEMNKQNVESPQK